MASPARMETMHLEYQRMLAAHPDLPARLEALPGRVFSGKALAGQTLKPGVQVVFFCSAPPPSTASPTPRAVVRWPTPPWLKPAPRPSAA